MTWQQCIPFWRACSLQLWDPTPFLFLQTHLSAWSVFRMVDPQSSDPVATAPSGSWRPGSILCLEWGYCRASGVGKFMSTVVPHWLMLLQIARHELHNIDYEKICDSLEVHYDQTKGLKKCQQWKKELERTIRYHQNMKMYRTIPRKFKPPSVPMTMNPDIQLTDDFNQSTRSYSLITWINSYEWQFNSQTHKIENWQHSGTHKNLCTSITTNPVWPLPPVPHNQPYNRPHTSQYYKPNYLLQSPQVTTKQH